jgi:hypothetical protein
MRSFGGGLLGGLAGGMLFRSLFGGPAAQSGTRRRRHRHRRAASA